MKIKKKIMEQLFDRTEGSLEEKGQGHEKKKTHFRHSCVEQNQQYLNSIKKTVLILNSLHQNFVTR